jgi:VWFA-related protein
MRILVAALVAFAMWGQAPPPPPAAGNAAEVTTRDEAPVFQSRVNLVRVPVVVRDSQGKAVGGLRQQDFQLYDKGKLQRVAQFAVEGSAVPKPTPAAPQDAGVPEEPSASSKPAPVLPTHFVAYVFDDMHLESGDLLNARQAALRHMEQTLKPTDRVAIFTLSGHVSLEFTDDRALQKTALQRIMPATPARSMPPISFYLADLITKGNDQDPGMNEPLQLAVGETVDCLQLQGPAAQQATAMAAATARQLAQQGRYETRNTLLMLGSLTGRLAAMPGDRAIVLVSPGFYLPDDLRTELTQVIDRATRANVIVNTLDARGVYAPSTVPDLPGCAAVSAPVAELATRYERDENVVRGLTLDELADATGGTPFKNNNDLFAGFNLLAAPPEYIYYLGFYPQDLKPDGSYHNLKVTLVNGKGLTVKARKGYWLPSHREDAAAEASREIQEAVFSRDEVRDLPIALHTQFFKSSEEDAKLKVITHLDLRSLRFHKEEGRNRDQVTVICALFDRNGNFVKGLQKIVEMRLKDETMARRWSSGIDVGTDFDVKIGAYLIRLVVRDTGGRQLAATNGTVDIP